MIYVVCYLKKDNEKVDFGKRGREVHFCPDGFYLISDDNRHQVAVIPADNVLYFEFCNEEVEGCQIQCSTIPANKLADKEVFPSTTTFIKTEMVNGLI